MKELEINIVDYSEEEIWLPVVGYEGLYEVSSLGKVRSLDRFSISGKSKVFVRGRDIKLTLNKRFGYLCIGLHKDGKDKAGRVNRLVAQAFIPNPENKPCVNHINGIKSDNRVENLEWCTSSENDIHAVKMGLRKISYKLSISDIYDILKSSKTQTELGKIYNITQSAISYIKVTKKHLL